MPKTIKPIWQKQYNKYGKNMTTNMAKTIQQIWEKQFNKYGNNNNKSTPET